VLDLYQRSFAGAPLGAGEYVISADEKTSIQARCRRHPTLPPGQARSMRVEHGYDRRGALAYLAAWDVHHARLFGRCEPTTGIEPFDRLVAQVMTTQPYAAAERVYWVIDNGSSHRGQASVKRLEGKYANLRLIHLPVHASWLNQIELYFSIVQRRSCPPTTSSTWSRSSSGCWASSAAISRSQRRSTGASPASTCSDSYADWMTRSSSPKPHDHHPRTSIWKFVGGGQDVRVVASCHTAGPEQTVAHSLPAASTVR
jgi:hypothetical protein